MPRYELFFHDAQHLSRVLQHQQHHRLLHMNLPNKGPALKGEYHRECVRAVVDALRADGRGGTLVAHWSLSHERERDFERSVARLQAFWAECGERHHPHVREVLLVSGAARRLDTVQVLRRLASGNDAGRLKERVRFGVAWDPYKRDAGDREDERHRLTQKLRSGLVGSVWLQFGTDAARLREELAWYREAVGARHAGVRVYGSVFLPTAQHVQRFRTKPWTGIECCAEYVDSVAGAMAVTERLLGVYREYSVEPLVESALSTDVAVAQCAAMLREFPCTEDAVGREGAAQGQHRSAKERRGQDGEASLLSAEGATPHRTAKERRGKRDVGGAGAATQRPISAWTEKAKMTPAAKKEAAVAVDGGEWQCAACTVVNTAAASACNVCGTAAPGASRDTPMVIDDDAGVEPIVYKAGQWQCAVCTVINGGQQRRCDCCDAPAPAAALEGTQDTPIVVDDGSSGSGGLVVMEPGQWQCTVCTVVNEGCDEQCAVCDAMPNGELAMPADADGGSGGTGDSHGMSSSGSGQSGSSGDETPLPAPEGSAPRKERKENTAKPPPSKQRGRQQPLKNETQVTRFNKGAKWGAPTPVKPGETMSQRLARTLADREAYAAPAAATSAPAAQPKKAKKFVPKQVEAVPEEGDEEETVTVFPAAKQQQQQAGKKAMAKQPRASNVYRMCVVLFRSHELRTRDFEPLAMAMKNADKFDVVVPVFLWGDPEVEAEVLGSPVRPQCAEVYIAVALEKLCQKFSRDLHSQLVCRRVKYKKYMEGGAARLDAYREACVAEVFRVARDVIHHDLRPGGNPRVAACSSVSITMYGGIRFEPVARGWDYDFRMDLLQHNAYALLAPHRAEGLEMAVDEVQLVNTSLLYDVAEVPVDLQLPNTNYYWGTLIPFLRCCKANFGQPRRPCGPVTNPRKLVKCYTQVKSSSGTTGDFSTLPLPAGVWGATIRGYGGGAPGQRHTWRQKLIRAWKGDTYVPFHLDEDSAHTGMLRWVRGEGLRQYDSLRSRIDIETAVTRLSPCLKWGTLAPTALYWAVEDERRAVPHAKEFAGVFSRRLFWRDLAYFQLHCFPDMHTMSVRPHYEHTVWAEPDIDEDAKAKLKAFCFGETGFPLVDAGMRELQETGWMQQNVRMVVASFLTEYLGMHWIHGFRIFHDNLIDADLAINAMMWQNGGRSGVDQWNFVLNPTNGATRDPRGTYTRRWCPELTAVPMPNLFRPRPHAIVYDLDAARQLTLERVRQMRARSLQYIDGGGIDLLRLPNGGIFRIFTRRELRAFERVGQLVIKDQVVDVNRLVDGRPDAVPGGGAHKRRVDAVGGLRKKKEESQFKKKKKSRLQ